MEYKDHWQTHDVKTKDGSTIRFYLELGNETVNGYEAQIKAVELIYNYIGDDKQNG